ncbi:ABC transporter permease subunit [Cellulomonas hominis]
MRAALVTEYRKLVTTRLWWVLLVSMAGYMLFLGAVLAFSFTMTDGSGSSSDLDPSALEPHAVAIGVYTLATSLGYVFPVIVGALSVTGEVRHHTLTPTFLAEPRRSIVLGAKLVASLLVGLVFGLVGTAVTVGGGATVLALRDNPTMLGEGDVQRTIALSVVALAIWCAVGVGFGAVLPNQVAAIVVLLAFTQFVEPLLRVFLSQFDATTSIAKFLPGAAGEAITGGSFYSTSGLTALLSPWQGMLVLTSYALALAAIGRLTTLRHDIT